MRFKFKLNKKSPVKIYLVTAFDISGVKSRQDYEEAKVDNILQKPLELFTFQRLIEQDLS